jgi:di/tricarboxylate transporter
MQYVFGKVNIMAASNGYQRFMVFLKAGLPFTLIGMGVVFGGLAGLRFFFSDSEYLTAILFLWLALFWFIYQPLFRKRILKVKNSMHIS